MRQIYVEIPKTTNETMISIPCGKDGDILWSFQIVFIESETLNARVVTVCDNGCEDEENMSAQSQIIKNKNDRLALFEYHIDKNDLKMDVKLKVFFSKEYRIVEVYC